MSFNDTIDNVVYELSTRPENIAEKPFVSKTWSNPIYDTNTSSNYASNQVIFSTEILSNSGSPVSYSEGLIILPLVIALTKTGGTTDWTDATLRGTDFVLGLKNSHVNIVDRVSVTLNNTDILQSVPMTNAYLTFIQHSEMSSEEENLNLALTGYSKDDSQSWAYVTPTTAGSVLTGDSRGIGICNNSNFKLINAFDYNDVANEGMLKRQRNVAKYDTERLSILGTTLQATREHQKNYVENLPSGKYIYYDCVLRLKDLCPNLFKNFPLTQGVKLKITLTLNNNVEFQFKKSSLGNFIYDYTSFSNVSSSTNPLMIASSYNKFRSQVGGTWMQTANNAGALNNSGNYTFLATDATINETIVPCGSSCLPCDDASVYKVRMAIGKIDNMTHSRNQCILYAPQYRMNPKHDLQYFSDQSRVRKIHYTDLEYQTFQVGAGNTFTKEISSSCVRPKRLILIPFLSKASNFNLDPVSSPFATEPATTSPCILTNFNCSINNQNLFPNDIQYSYDHYIQNLNGQTGVSANQVAGLVSSRINMLDFQNNYSYFVVDLSRRLPEQDLISNSIKIRGKIASNKDMDFHCFIEVEKIIEIDCLTGALINRY